MNKGCKNTGKETGVKALRFDKAECRIALLILLFIYYSIIAVMVGATFFVVPHTLKAGLEGELWTIWSLLCMAVMWFMLSDKFHRAVNPWCLNSASHLKKIFSKK